MVARVLSCLLLLALLLTARPAGADVAEDARREYELGFQELERRNFRAALSHYQRSQDLLSRPRTTFNIALCHEGLGNYQAAIAEYQRFLNEAEARDTEFLASAREKIALLHSRIGGTLQIRSEPSGASVSVDGQLKGHTPLRLDLLAGEHILQLSHKAARSSERVIDVRVGDEHVENFQLDPVGRVSLRVNPPDALIRRRDVDAVATGHFEAELSPGTYHFELSLMGYNTRSLKIVVKASDIIQKTIRLRGHTSTGALKIQSDVSGVNVTVDGIIVGSTRRREEGNVAELERRLTAGNHVLIVEARDAKPWRKQVHVSPGETIAVDLRFRGQSKQRKYVRWGLTAFGSAALATGLAMGAIALSDVRGDSRESHDRGFDRAGTADVLLGLGALSLGGAYLLSGDDTLATVHRTHEEEGEGEEEEIADL